MTTATSNLIRIVKRPTNSSSSTSTKTPCSSTTWRKKFHYLLSNNYYEQEVVDQYSFDFIKSLFKRAYAKKFRFPTFLGAYKYYTSYTLQTFDGRRYLERYEDRVCMVASRSRR